MKIENVMVRKIKLPIAPKIVSAVGSVDHLGCLLILIRGSNGHEGENLVFTLNDRFTGPLERLIAELANELVGRTIDDLQANWDHMHRTLGFFGLRGFSTMAIGALDGALWDLRGREQGLSIATMLGRTRDTVKVYDSGGLWLHMSREELIEYTEQSLLTGFRAVKLRLGAKTINDDMRRIEKLASAVGDRALLMADANQFYSEQDAIYIGRALQDNGFHWYEEPSNQMDFSSAARICAALGIPIAAGENCYSRYDAAELLGYKSAQIFMPDLQRIGGVTEFTRSMRYAETGGLEISSHLFPEYSLQLLGASQRASFLEYVPWFSGLFREAIEIRDGIVAVPDRPGWGFTFNWEAIEEFV